MFSCVLFDLDNTLVVRQPSLIEEIWALCRSVQPDIPFTAVQRAHAAAENWSGRQILYENQTGERMDDEAFFSHVAAVYVCSLGLPELVIGKAMRHILQNNHRRPLVLYPDALPLLQRLQSLGVRMGVVSNNMSEVRLEIERLGLTAFFADNRPFRRGGYLQARPASTGNGLPSAEPAMRAVRLCWRPSV